MGTRLMNGKSLYSELLQPYIDNLLETVGEPGELRRELLRQAASTIHNLLSSDGAVDLNFICTHNSRRSHFAQVWCFVALQHYGVEHVRTWSGGTEVTQCNPRTISALRRAGFSVVVENGGENPKYRLEFQDSSNLRCFSKLYGESPNPENQFVALLCCSDVDEKCPVIRGAIERIRLHYRDPKFADSTPLESEAYDDCCSEIAVEMFFLAKSLAELGGERALSN